MYGRIRIDDSTIPTKMFAAEETATAPPMRSTRSNTQANPLTIAGSTRQ